MAGKQDRSGTETLRLGAELATLRSEFSGGLAELCRGADLRYRVAKSLRRSPLPWAVGAVLLTVGIVAFFKQAHRSKDRGRPQCQPTKESLKTRPVNKETVSDFATAPEVPKQEGIRRLVPWIFGYVLKPLIPTLLATLWKLRPGRGKEGNILQMLVKSVLRS